MAKRKEVCIKCGWASQELHSMCWSCHTEDMGNMAEDIIAKVGNDYFFRCDENDCWVCLAFKFENKRTRPPKLTKKQMINMAQGRYGKRNKKAGIDALEQRRLAEDKANMREKRNSQEIW
jgi:hypothetical protein